MAFDPDKYLAAKTAPAKGGFDPDAYLASKAQDPGALHDVGVGLGQGATLGFGDEILGGLQAGKDVLSGDAGVDELADAYRKHQKENEKGVDEAKARRPKTVLGSEIAGGLLPALLSGGTSEAATGANAVKTLGQLAAEQAGKGAVLGGIAGVGGSHGTIDNPEEIAKDAAFGAGGGAMLGGAMPYAGELAGAAKNALGDAGSAIGGVAKAPLNKLAQLIEDSPSLRNLNDARKLKAATGQSFTGKKAVQQVNDEINKSIDGVTDQVYGTRTKANEAYGEGLAGSAPTETTKSEQLKAFNKMVNGSSNEMSPEDRSLALQLGATPEQLASETSSTAGRGGMTVEGKALLQKAATQGGLNAQETKTLQNLINEAKAKPGYADTNVPGDAADSLNPIIDNSLPEADLAKINSEYTGKLKSAEPFLNNGEVNPAQQKNSFNDTDPTNARAKIADYLAQVVKKSRDPNVSGAETNATFQRALGNAKNINGDLDAPVLNPDAIGQSVDNAALKSNIVKSIYGDRAQGQTPGVIGKLSDAVTGSPMRTALGVGAAQRAVGKAADTIAVTGRNLYQSTNEGLSRVAQTLTGAGHVDIGNSLNKALTSGDTGAKNAALFTIMQNPNYRKAVFGDDSSDEGTK